MKAKKVLIYMMPFLLLFGCEEEKLDILKYGSLSGIILNGEDYSPLEGVQVSTSPASSTILTDADGKFSLSKVAEGEVAVTARKNNYLSTSVNVSVYEKENTELTFFLLKDDTDAGWVTLYDPVPGNGAVGQSISLTFKWSVDQQKNDVALEYSVYVFKSGSTIQQIVGENLTTTEVVVSGLSYETTYFWYVVAKYEGNKVAYSPTWTFKTTKNSN